MATMGALGLDTALAPTAVLPKGTAPFGGGLAAADAGPWRAADMPRPTTSVSTSAPNICRTPTILTPAGRLLTSCCGGSSGALVDGVDQQAQARVVEAVEAEGQPGQLGIIVALGRKGGGGADGAAGDDVGETTVEVGQLCLARFHLHPQHEEVAHPADRVVVAVEAQDLRAGLLHGVGHLEQSPVVGG